MSIYQMLCLIGLPSLIVAVVTALFTYLCKQNKKNRDDTKAVKKGVQALLRAQMIDDYNKWTERGYAPIYARQNFENCWAQYHSLGANGVMDDIHIKFLALPIEKPEEVNTNAN